MVIVRNVIITSIMHIVILFTGSSLCAYAFDKGDGNSVIVTTGKTEVVDIERVTLRGRLSNGSNVDCTVTLKDDNLNSITVEMMGNRIKVPNEHVKSIDKVQYQSIALEETSLSPTDPKWRLILVFSYGDPKVTIHDGKKETQYNLVFYDFASNNYDGRSRDIIHTDGTSELIHD